MRTDYVIFEEWDNGEEYDLHMDEHEIIALANTEDLAKEIIQKTIDKLIQTANDSGIKYEYETFEEYGIRTIDFRYDSVIYRSPFDNPTCGFESFSYYYKPMEVQGS